MYVDVSVSQQYLARITYTTSFNNMSSDSGMQVVAEHTAGCGWNSLIGKYNSAHGTKKG